MFAINLFLTALYVDHNRISIINDTKFIALDEICLALKSTAQYCRIEVTHLTKKTIFMPIHKYRITKKNCSVCQTYMELL
jgi:hypothetical protein